MKHIAVFLFLACLAWNAGGQIPESYERAFRKHERRLEKAERRAADSLIWLDPIESFPIEPTFYALETGNWGGTYLGINQRAEEISGRAKRNVVVFIFDTGGCYSHPLLKLVAWNELGGVFTGEASCEDGHGHSTHVAGIVAASHPDYPLGAARMLPIKVVPVKVLSNGGSGSFASITNGTLYANGKAKELIEKGWFVIYNYSLGGSGSYAPLEAAFKAAEEMGVLINVAANGNTGARGVQYPGSSQYTLGTAALAQSGSGVERASYSTYGPETWGAAPGSMVLSSWPPDVTRLLSGTSMATPHQAAVFAILASVWPKATAAQLKAHYIKYAADLGAPGRDEYYGYGAGLIGPLLDNAPDGSEPPPPPEPSCTDGIKNGKETGVDCGGPDCPPCPDPGKPPYKKRTLPLDVSGSWTIGWIQPENSQMAAMARMAGDAQKSAGAWCFGMDEMPMAYPTGRTDIVVTRMMFDVASETTYAYEHDALLKNAAAFFRNRTLGTPKDWDVYHAAPYVLYFLDYYVTNLFAGYTGQALKPTGLEIQWQGRKVVVRATDLPDYKKQ